MRAVSFFSGAGGFDLGIIDAGVEVVAAYEVDAQAVNTYRLNIGPCHHADIAELDIDSIPDADIYFGGPPCQGFSQAGPASITDERNSLLLRFVEIVCSKRPAAFIMENVSALLRRKKWAHLKDEVVSTFEAAGYSVRVMLLNASEHGVCQARERVFFMGVLDGDLDGEVETETPLTVREVLASIPRQWGENPSRVVPARNPIVHGSPYTSDLLFNGRGRILNLDGVARTIPAAGAGNHAPIVDEAWRAGGESWGAQYHDSLKAGGAVQVAPPSLRRITAAEAAAFQSFPPAFRFVGTRAAQVRQIGNAVPPRLAYHVGRFIVAALCRAH